ncbi:lysophospholipid acyltransferase family protein [Foetidibacter luteolus]|uniref:lysophospholipid acyltransferase family protein n=1 Tax=Foetidibacter luteolus TaxID=2608880 RepID=UPI00129BB90C|nr:lysophospholipid acyltransferase family protein [Foetidibacter luteolus]
MAKNKKINISYYLLLPFWYLLSVLPFPVLYLLADFAFFIVYRVTGYRKQIVLTNLRNSFPEKTEAEINDIARKFYGYLCDMFLETFVTLTISRKKMLERCQFDPEALALFNRMADEDKSSVLVMGHYGNWEWAGNTFALCCRQRLYVIYHPLASESFNRLMFKIRSRFGNGLIAMKDTGRAMLGYRNEVTTTAFIADQTPSNTYAYWTNFLNQDTPVFWGTEKIAGKFNYPVIYVTVKRAKRGYYRIYAEMLEENPAQTREGEISEKHTRKLEQDIKEQPEIWLWSHRRWKHSRRTD